MAFTTVQTNFNGVLNGTNITELNSKIDYTKTKLEERKEVVNDIIDNTMFYEDYFSDYFKANINSSDQLSSNINVCKSLERMANYLLNSKEIKQQEDAERTKYIFYTDEKYFQKKLSREQSINQRTSPQDSDHENNIIHFLKRNESNFKKEKRQTTDFKNIKPNKTNSQEDVDDVKRILGEYQSFQDYVTELLLDKDRVENRFLLTKIKGQLTDDMIYTKDVLLGVFGYELRNGQKEDSKPDLNIFDFTNMDHLYGKTIEVHGKTRRGKPTKTKVMAKGLIFFRPTSDFQDDFNITLVDLQNTIDEAGLTKFEKEVLELSRSGLTQEEIAEILNTYHKKISRTTKLIAKKIIAVGNKYDLAEK